ncbi:MAG: hypothetical protein R2759_10480 [Bacteroidales bacterium]
MQALVTEIVRNYERTQPNVNRLNYTLDRWTGPGTSDEVPGNYSGYRKCRFSDYYVEDGSYLRIQRVQLGYTLGDQISEKIGFLKNCAFVAITNLVTFTKYMGFESITAIRFTYWKRI